MSSSSPAALCAAVTPNDSVDLANGRCRALYIGIGGDVSVPGAGGSPVVFKDVPGGSVLPVSASRVRATGTTASNIVALY